MPRWKGRPAARGSEDAGLGQSFPPAQCWQPQITVPQVMRLVSVALSLLESTRGG